LLFRFNCTEEKVKVKVTHDAEQFEGAVNVVVEQDVLWNT
jgi:hypothetical protein